MKVLNRMSEVSKNRKLKPGDIKRKASTSLLTSLNNIQMIYNNGLKQITELTNDNRLIYKMFNAGQMAGLGK